MFSHIRGADGQKYPRRRKLKGISAYAAAKGRLRRGAVFLWAASGARVNTFATVTFRVALIAGILAVRRTVFCFLRRLL